MRLMIFLLFIILLTQPVLSQPPSNKDIAAKMQETNNRFTRQVAELEKQIATAKKENPDKVKSLEEKLAMLKQQQAMTENVSRMMGKLPQQEQVVDNGSGFPARKTALLNALPKKTLSTQELTAFMTSLHNDLKKKYSSQIVDSAMAVFAKYKADYAKIAMTGVAAWYNTAPSESVLILTYAASKSPTDNILNNCGAVLNLVGMEEKALPVLKYVLPRHKENCTLLNNIGQAFAGLGAKDSAMFYFSRVLRKCGTHPDANATAAYIEHDNGNDAAAAAYMEKSLTGAFSETRFDFLKMIKPDAKPIVDPDKVNMNKEEYFVPNGLVPAPNCTNWDVCEKVNTQQNATFNKIAVLRKKYEEIVVANSLGKILEDPQENANYLSRKGWKPGPFSKKASYLIEGLANLYGKPRQEYGFEIFEKISKLTQILLNKSQALDLEFQPKYKACEGVGGNCLKNVMYQYCLRKTALDNEQFASMSKISEDYETAWYAKDVKYYNDMVFLRTLVVPHERVRKADCAAFTVVLLGQIKGFTLSTCQPSGKPECIPPPPPESAQDYNPFFKDGKCLIDVKIPFVVGSMSLNCESFSIEGGEGVTFRYEKNFKSKETTLAVGLGVNADIPGIDAGASVEIGVKFDANNQPIDLIGSAQAGMGITGMNTQLVGVGASVGVNSSFTPSFVAFGK